MVKTNKQKEKARAARLQSLPQAERLKKSALIKKREGRVLNAAEKHAMKMSSEYGEIIRLWEVLRVSSDAPKCDSDTTKSVVQQKALRYEHKYPTVDLMLRLIEPKFSTYVKTPRVSRVIQSIIKYASLDQLERVLRLLSNDFATYATDAYAHFVVTALIRHAPHSFLDKILALIIPVVSVLVSHRFGIVVLHSAYSNRLCTATNRNILILSVFKENVVLMRRWKGYPVLEDVLQQETTQRKRLLTTLFELCDRLVSQKGAAEYPFVQRLVAAYMRAGIKDEVSELCDTLRPHLATLCTTREGAPLVTLAYALTEPKKRKEVLRAISGNLGIVAVDKYGAPVIARLFDLVYDLQLLRKYIVNDLEAHITQIINSPFGHKILLHILTPHNERKDKFLLPNWLQHNLFSMENKQWNCHTWLTHDYKEETVEICPKSALSTHLAVLPSIVRKFLEVVSSSETAPKLNRHHTGLIAREVLTVCQAEAAYKTALRLTKEDTKVLSLWAPARGQQINKRPRENEVNATKATSLKKLKVQSVEMSSATTKKTSGTIGRRRGDGVVAAATKPEKKAKGVKKSKKLLGKR